MLSDLHEQARTATNDMMVPVEGIEPPLLAEHDFEFVRVYQFRHTGMRAPTCAPISMSPNLFGKIGLDVFRIALDAITTRRNGGAPSGICGPALTA